MDISTVISVLGIIAAMILLVILVMKGINIFLIAFICTAVVALSGQINLYDAFKVNYMEGFVGFLKAIFLFS